MSETPPEFQPERPSQSPPPLPATSHGDDVAAAKSQSIWKRKISFGKFGSFGDSWRRFAFANSATRREAKAILFQELAEAVRHGMPLDEALECCMRSHQDVTQAGNDEKSATKGNALGWFGALFFYFWFSFGGILLLLFTSSWASDVEHVARVLARRLLPLVRAGHSLSAAMGKLPQDYSREEVATIEAGELTGNLAIAMDRLGQFQYYERELQRHWNRMSYPVWLLIVMSSLMMFVTIFIVPKFKDIYDQMNFELPQVTQFLINVGNAIVRTGMGIVPVVLSFAAWVLILRWFMVGNRTMRNLTMLVIIISFEWMFVGGFVALLEYDVFKMLFIPTPVYVAAIVIVALLAGVLGFVFLMRLERMVLWFERRFGGWFGYIPIFGAPRQTERESRWLAALSMALSSGADSAGAMGTAGAVVGGGMGRRTARAAELIRGGHSIGTAVVEANVLRPRFGHRVRLLDDRPGFLQGLSDIADDAARESFHTLNRASRIGEVVSICLIGGLVFLFAMGLYMPLFNIPTLFGHY